MKKLQSVYCRATRSAFDAFAIKYYKIRHSERLSVLTNSRTPPERSITSSVLFRSVPKFVYKFQFRLKSDRNSRPAAVESSCVGSTAATYSGGPWFKFHSTDGLRSITIEADSDSLTLSR